MPFENSPHAKKVKDIFIKWYKSLWNPVHVHIIHRINHDYQNDFIFDCTLFHFYFSFQFISTLIWANRLEIVRQAYVDGFDYIRGRLLLGKQFLRDNWICFVSVFIHLNFWFFFLASIYVCSQSVTFRPFVDAKNEQWAQKSPERNRHFTYTYEIVLCWQPKYLLSPFGCFIILMRLKNINNSFGAYIIKAVKGSDIIRSIHLFEYI